MGGAFESLDDLLLEIRRTAKPVDIMPVQPELDAARLIGQHENCMLICFDAKEMRVHQRAKSSLYLDSGTIINLETWDPKLIRRLPKLDASLFITQLSWDLFKAAETLRTHRNWSAAELVKKFQLSPTGEFDPFNL